MKTNDVNLWKERFANRAASGLKVEDWCKRNSVTKHASPFIFNTIIGGTDHVSKIHAGSSL